MKRTPETRKHDSLFLSVTSPFKPVCIHTISHWLKQCLSLAGIDSDIFKAHSFRHASTSKAFANGCNVNYIFKRAGWLDDSSVFTRFYNRPVCMDNFTSLVLS